MQTTTKPRCHYRFHLRGCPLTVYELALAWTSKTGGTFFASAAKITSHCAYSVQGVRKALRWLVRYGWMRQVGFNQSDRKAGRFHSNEYVVVSHDVWCLEHPGHCRVHKVSPVPMIQSSTGDDKSAQIGSNHR